ncbi:MAG: ribbon-helix-helix domain-containing protein [bacterium]|nr:ribbon-helix-helix domain-containing protein [bacterium]
MGRSRKNALQVYLSDDELALMNDRMKELGYKSKSEFIRKAAIQCVLFNVNTDGIIAELLETKKEIHKIGVNINQIASKVNSTDMLYKKELLELQEGQKKIWLTLTQTLSTLL